MADDDSRKLHHAGDGIATQPVEVRALLATLGTGDAVVGVQLDHLPVALLSGFGELLALILDGLRTCRHSQVERDLLRPRQPD
jgi:hypothetical protein